MPLQSLSITNVGPFGKIEFEFDSRVNVFVGPNNSGKSSVLCALGDVTVFPFDFPEKLLHEGRDSNFEIRLSSAEGRPFEGQFPILGVLNYWNPERRQAYVDNLKSIGYSKFIPGLRKSTDFRSPGPRSTRTQDSEDQSEFQLSNSGIFRLGKSVSSRGAGGGPRKAEEIEPELRKRLALVSDDASLVSDEAVIQKIIELDYRSYLKNQPVFRDIIVKIGDMASDITADFPIDYMGADEDDEGFYPKFETIDGPVPLNTLSQGTQSIVQWLARLIIGYAEYYDFPDDLEERPGVLIVDEVDAHLHPSWQRRIIPTLTNHFPRLQVFFSTHSPLMLAGLGAGQVHMLQRDENGTVTVSRNEADIVGWTADEILRTYMGVPDPTDLQTEGQLERLQQLQFKRSLTPEEEAEVEDLRRTIDRILMEGSMSAPLAQFADALRQVTADPPVDSSRTK